MTLKRKNKKEETFATVLKRYKDAYNQCKKSCSKPR